MVGGVKYIDISAEARRGPEQPKAKTPSNFEGFRASTHSIAGDSSIVCLTTSTARRHRARCSFQKAVREGYPGPWRASSMDSDPVTATNFDSNGNVSARCTLNSRESALEVHAASVLRKAE